MEFEYSAPLSPAKKQLINESSDLKSVCGQTKLSIKAKKVSNASV
jgi:hypothetical protein